MKVKIIKSISIADKSPALPIVHVVEGEVRDDLSEHVANRLIELGCASQVADDEKPEVKEPEKVEVEGASEEVVELTPETLKVELEAVTVEKQSGVMGSEKKAKKALEDIGKKRFGFDVDKRMSIPKMIDAIVEAAFKDK